MTHVNIVASTNLILVNTHTYTNAVVLLPTTTYSGQVVTIRDSGGNASSNNIIYVSTMAGVSFQTGVQLPDGSNLIKLQQPFAFITLSSYNGNQWSILNTFGFQAQPEVLHVAEIAVSTIQLSDIITGNPTVIALSNNYLTLNGSAIQANVINPLIVSSIITSSIQSGNFTSGNGNPPLVAVGTSLTQSGSIQTSVDGVNWYPVNSGGFDLYSGYSYGFGVAYSQINNQWIATGLDNNSQNSMIQQSTDGLNWSPATSIAGSHEFAVSVATGGPGALWVATALSYIPAVGILYSQDGLNWNQAISGGFSAFYAVWGMGVAASPSMWVVTGVGTTQVNTIQYSTDGSNWNNAESGGFINTNGTTSFIGMSVSYGNNQWIAIGVANDALNTIQYSSDGMNWNSIISGGFEYIYSSGYSGYYQGNATWNGSLWVAVGRGTSAVNSILYSSDGSNWSNAISGGFDNGASVYAGTGITWTGLMWVATGIGNNQNTTIQTSYDGCNWTLFQKNGGFYSDGVSLIGQYYKGGRGIASMPLSVVGNLINGTVSTTIIQAKAVSLLDTVTFNQQLITINKHILNINNTPYPSGTINAATTDVNVTPVQTFNNINNFISTTYFPQQTYISSIIGNSSIGIACNSPSYNLDVHGTINFTGGLLSNGTAYNPGLPGNIAFISGNNSQQWTNANHFFSTVTVSTLFYASSIGICCNAPQSALDINGNMILSGNLNGTSISQFATLSNIAGFGYTTTTALNSQSNFLLSNYMSSNYVLANYYTSNYIYNNYSKLANTVFTNSNNTFTGSNTWNGSSIFTGSIYGTNSINISNIITSSIVGPTSFIGGTTKCTSFLASSISIQPTTTGGNAIISLRSDEIPDYSIIYNSVAAGLPLRISVSGDPATQRNFQVGYYSGGIGLAGTWVNAINTNVYTGQTNITGPAVIGGTVSNNFGPSLVGAYLYFASGSSTVPFVPLIAGSYSYLSPSSWAWIQQSGETPNLKSCIVMPGNSLQVYIGGITNNPTINEANRTSVPVRINIPGTSIVTPTSYILTTLFS